MRLPRPQPDHRSVWTTQRQLCPGRGPKGHRQKGTAPQPGNHRPNSQPGTGLSPPPPWQLPPHHCLPSPQCRKHNSHKGRGLPSAQSSRYVRGCAAATRLPQPLSSAPGRQSRHDPVLPAPSRRPSLGTPGCREAGNARPRPPPASGYPFGSDPRPGLSQTVPRHTPPIQRPPGTSYSPRSTPTYSGGSRTRGNLFPSPPPAEQGSPPGGGADGHKVPGPAP